MEKRKGEKTDNQAEGKGESGCGRTQAWVWVKAREEPDREWASTISILGRHHDWAWRKRGPRQPARAQMWVNARVIIALLAHVRQTQRSGDTKSIDEERSPLLPVPHLAIRWLVHFFLFFSTSCSWLLLLVFQDSAQRCSTAKSFPHPRYERTPRILARRPTGPCLYHYHMSAHHVSTTWHPADSSESLSMTCFII